jgi:hypothetical protein
MDNLADAQPVSLGVSTDVEQLFHRRCDLEKQKPPFAAVIRTLCEQPGRSVSVSDEEGCHS